MSKGKRQQNRTAGPDGFAVLVGLDVGALDVAGVETALGTVGRSRGWLDAIESQLLVRSERLAKAGRGGGARESAVLSGGRSSRGAALAAGRADTLDRVPELADALEAGETSADHVDALTRAGSGLSDDKRDVLFADVELSGAARRMGPDPFATEVKRKARLLAKDEGEAKLQQQQNATNLRKWVRKDGMHVLNGEFDPETGSRLFRAIDTETETLAQTNSLAKNDKTQAAALAALVERGLGAGPADAVPEVIVIDAATLTEGLHEHSVSETSSGAQLPPETVRRTMCQAIILPTIINANGKTLASGRDIRVANRKQRRALRAMYPTCAFDTCTAQFDHCQIHHIVPWQDGGPTDLDNLIPLCGRHHHLVHEGHWRIHLEPDRSLVITQPDGQHFKALPLPTQQLAAALTTRAGPGTPEQKPSEKLDTDPDTPAEAETDAQRVKHRPGHNQAA